MNQKKMLFEYIASQDKPQSLDNIMDYVGKENKDIPRSTIRARLSELRKGGIKIDNTVKKIEKKEAGWVVNQS